METGFAVSSGIRMDPLAGSAQVRKDIRADDAVSRRRERAVENREQQEQREIERLKQIDREVRAHEHAHKAVGGRYAGPERYEYQQGPDGNQYAVGGEVSIDISREREPDATITKMRIVRAAALAPAQPSAQDMQVAAAASKIEGEARVELARQTYERMKGRGGETAGMVLSAYA
jgi:hypothetical protein